MNHTSILSISHKNKLDCENVAEFLGKIGFLVDVTSNISMQPNKEYGCRILYNANSKKDISYTWNLLKNKYNLECAHLKVENKFSGCVLDFLKPSICSNNICNSKVIYDNPEYVIKSYD
tara:strand:- start:1766 stop:2122 length:357 start_codon:yes stop_codon:yes gene_type:complete